MSHAVSVSFMKFLFCALQGTSFQGRNYIGVFFVNGNGVERGGQKTRLERGKLDPPPPKIIKM